MERLVSQILLLALFLPLHCLMGCGLSSSVNTDRPSLLALKSHITSDPRNILRRNWTTQTFICNWIGVACDSLDHNQVIGLNLSNMELVGTIPPEIGNLSSLVSLDMNDNFFYGPILPSIFNISSLEVITLQKNGLSSKLPIDMCEHSLHNLKVLRMSFNKLYGEIPSSLGQCSKLETLSLYDNSLGGEVPREIGNLTLLTSLFLGFNSLTERNDGYTKLSFSHTTFLLHEKRSMPSPPSPLTPKPPPPSPRLDSHRPPLPPSKIKSSLLTIEPQMNPPPKPKSSPSCEMHGCE